jgi:DNA repair photolyase
MYPFVDYTWNAIKGECAHDCSYCYKKRWVKQSPLHLDERELKTDLGSGNFIFVCSGCDLFSPDVPKEWIERVWEHAKKYPKNRYLWHTKNPRRLASLIEPSGRDTACVTLESNRWYLEVYRRAPPPIERVTWLNEWEGKRMIAVEPVLDFDPDLFCGMILETLPVQVNIGADSGRNNLPEPSKEKVIKLIKELEKFTRVYQKKNLGRLLK